MAAKDFLRSLRKMDAEIRALQLQIEKLRGDAEGVKAMAISDMPKGGNGYNAGDLIAEVVDLQAVCAMKMRELVKHRSEAVNIIMKIGRTDQRAVLMLYYCNCQSWEQVADALNYSVRQVLRIHGEALVEFEAHDGRCH